MAANEKETYPWPDPLAPPKFTGDNPHTGRTCSSTPSLEIPASWVAYTDAVYDRLFLPLDQLLGNVCGEQVEPIKATPETFLVVIPYGAGNGLYTKKGNQHLNQDILAFLKTFRFARAVDEDTVAVVDLDAITEGAMPEQVEAAYHAQDAANPDTQGMQIVMPTQSGTGNGKDRYGKPWAMFLTGGSEWLRDFLAYQQTFAIDKTLTFSIMKFEPAQFLWIIANFSGDSVLCEAEGAILTAVKRSLWYHDEFRFLIDKILTKNGVPGTVNDHAVHMTASFTLAFFNNTDDWGCPATVAQLCSKLIATNIEDQRAYLHIIRTTQYWVDLAPLKLAGSIDCQLCKADTHPTYGCPFFKTEGWYGPTYDGVERHAQHVQKANMKPTSQIKRGRGGHPQKMSAGKNGRKRVP
ncbi:hypothetical protein WOLCODRAFT_157939 [Wolfiporia cocos MD-104 SS10]|uniref:Uncharacterized protein n=1 Tax=Wolfiporia cocos (strain MD-104) TaxID=742152 RepID=A0A2H3JHN4_WOLCO|nr:hypothetical protein WOLCODRAFT_157939 [Wolfiporia cocos MD-104 SS10]